MKKLKKGLSLLLVLAMVFSLATTAFAGWDVSKYGDADQITQDEAVAVMTGLGVIEGDDTTGLFQPTGTYTREAAAKVLTYMLLGPTAASKLTATTDPFDDVPADRWSAGCIAYLANEGIIEGYGDGNFGPQKELTQAAWLKMLLCAMGYDADKSGMGDDPNWATKAQALAVKSDLISGKDLGLDWNRETAVYYAFKAVEKNKNLADNTVDAKPFIVTVDTYDDASTDKRPASTDDFGRPTQEYIAKGAKEAYAAYTADPVLTYENEVVTKAALAKDLGLSAKAAANTTYTVTIDGVVTKGELATNKATVGTYGGTVEVYENANSTAAAPAYDVVVINTYAKLLTKDDVKAATDTTDAYIIVDGDVNAGDEANGYYTTDEFAAGDVVIYTKTIKNSKTAEIKSVEKAEYTEGVVSGYTTDYVRVDGEQVTRAQACVSVSVSADKTTKKAVYLDSYGNVAYVGSVKEDTTEEQATYVYVIDRVATAAVVSTSGVAGATNTTIVTPATAYAKVVDLATGEVKTVAESIKLNDEGDGYEYTGTGAVTASSGAVTTVTSDAKDGAGSTIGAGVVGEGKIMSYTVKEDGSYELTTVTNDSKVSVTKDSASVVNYANDLSSKFATSATELNVITVTDETTKDAVAAVTTETGIANFTTKDYSQATGFKTAYIEVNATTNKITRMYVVISKTTPTTSSVAHAIYLGVGETGSTQGYKFVVKGEITTYYAAGGVDLSTTLAVGNVGEPFTLALDNDGKLTASTTDETVVEATEANIVDATYVVLATGDQKELTKTCLVLDATDAENPTYAVTTVNEGDTVKYVMDTSETSKIDLMIVTKRKTAE